MQKNDFRDGSRRKPTNVAMSETTKQKLEAIRKVLHRQSGLASFSRSEAIARLVQAYYETLVARGVFETKE